MEDKCEVDNKGDDVMLPGFRFHPTDEELVGFYLRKKVQGRVLPIELIKQVDIYKYDPWDLPKFASTGEKEWYFYCPRDRKYRNSTRPNRVTGAGFWKATGTDRPIYSSEGTKCIGLKKSLVFYRGRAAKGLKTDWMMHEFRLPSSVTPDSNPSNKKFLDRNIPPNDLWVICRIFRKTNTMAQQRAMSHQWGLQFPIGPELLGQASHSTSSFSPENLSCTTDIGSATQLGTSTGSINDLQYSNFYANTGTHLYRSTIPNVCKSSSFMVCNGEIANNFMFSPIEGPNKSSLETSMIIAPTQIADGRKSAENVDLEGPQQFVGGYSDTSARDLQASMGDSRELENSGARKEPGDNNGSCQWANTIKPVMFPFSLPSSMPWDSPPCPTDVSTSFPTNKCYT